MQNPQHIVPTLELVDKVPHRRLFEIDRDEVSIGRDRRSDIHLDRKEVSSTHARVFRRPDGFFLEDRGSYNHTYLDDRKLTAFAPTRLRDGSRIKICESLLIFHLEAVKIEEHDDDTTIMGVLADPSSVDPAAMTAGPEEVLKGVLEINRTLGGSIALNEALGKVLEAFFAIFPQAECGFILTSEPGGELIPRAIRRRNGDAEGLTLSHTVLDHVMNEGQGLLIRDAGADARFKDVPSLSGSRIRTVVCMPLLDHDARPIGIIQLDNRSFRAQFRPDDLDLLAAVSAPIGVAIANHRFLKAKAEREAAGEVLRAMLPRGRPGAREYTFWDLYEPAMVVGGDYYDYHPIAAAEAAGDAPCARWAIALGDVVGKGMPAALLVTNLCSEVRHHVRTEADPRRIVERLNRAFHDAENPGRFITFLLVVLDADSHALTVVNAGHMGPLIRRAGGELEVIGQAEAGLPLAVDHEHTYQAATTLLEPGDVVVLYTDGVDSAMNPRRKLFGLAAVKQTVAAAPGEVPRVGEALIDAVHAHAAGQDPFDDITIICFGRSALA
jgi:serine phosphatase RsbU (regulator of sigma subunit)/pSer/pThr/pTyr-binding forkhead associated (FHA) protein